MKNRILIVVMSSLGIGMALNPYTNKINPGLVKGTAWLFSGLVANLLK